MESYTTMTINFNNSEAAKDADILLSKVGSLTTIQKLRTLTQKG